MNKTHHVALLSRDGLFCKDGRGWHSSASGHGHALDWPWPSTLRGALLTAWGRQDEQTNGHTKTGEEWLEHKAKGDVTLAASFALRRKHGINGWTTEHRVWPAPADALWLESEKNVWRLDPREDKYIQVQTLGRNVDAENDPAREALWRPETPNASKPKSAPRWLDEEAFVKWLCTEDLPASGSDDFLKLEKRVQAHVKINRDTLTAEESMLFSHDILEMSDKQAEWAIGAKVGLKDNELPDLATLGSDGRLACIEGVEEDLFRMPGKVLSAFDNGCKGLRLIVVTPALFKNGWLPDGFSARDKEYRGTLSDIDGEMILRAAFVPRPIHISGWDMASGGPKVTARMVPPGAVYFFEREGDSGFTKTDAEKLWLAALGGRQKEGFGCVVPGIWNAKGKET